MIELQLFRPHPKFVRYVTGHEGQYDAHECIDDGGKEQQEVDLGKDRLHLEIEVGGVRVSQKDGKFHDSKGRKFAVHLLQHGLGKWTAVRAPINFVPGNFDHQNETEG